MHLNFIIRKKKSVAKQWKKIFVLASHTGIHLPKTYQIHLVSEQRFVLGINIREWILAKARVEAAFEFFEKLNVPYFCLHDVDIAPEGSTLKESNQNL